MSQWKQADAIASVRAHLDDAVDGKIMFKYSPLLGAQDGTNKVFQIPQERIQSVTPYKNNSPLASPADFLLTNPKQGLLQFTVALKITDQLETTFAYTWFFDDELDHFLNCAANQCGFESYHTDVATVPGSEVITNLPADIPTQLRAAITDLATAQAASTLSSRFAVKYEVSSGDQSFSPEAMSERYGDLAEKKEKSGLNARDDFYKGSGTQYRPAMGNQGYILPTWSPKK